MKVKIESLSKYSPKEWILFPAILFTTESPFYIQIGWLRWYLEINFYSQQN